MKSNFVLPFCSFIILVSLVKINAVPAKSYVKDEVETIPQQRPNQFIPGEAPIIDTNANDYDDFNSYYNPFDGFLKNFGEMMLTLRRRMDTLLKKYENRNNSTSINEFSEIGIPVFPNIDLGKGNTTSITKHIDGHKVVINETQYNQEDDFGGSFFKVRIINVQPDSSEITTEKQTEEVSTSYIHNNINNVGGGGGGESTRDVEAVENSFENEISKNKEIEVGNNNKKSKPEKLVVSK